jgi:ubiquinone/menaquinone biosynthesis C-methylase UbiE
VLRNEWGIKDDTDYDIRQIDRLHFLTSSIKILETKLVRGNNTKRKITNELLQEYWDKYPCDAAGIDFPQGSIEFFETMEERRYSFQQSIYALAQFTRWRNKKVLEVGFGCGTDLLQFARAEADLYGIDLSKRAVKLTSKRLELYGLQANIIHGDAEDMPFPDNYFDLVYCWGVIHHTVNPTKVSDEIYRVLKPGGSFRGMVHHNSLYWLWLWYKYAFSKGKIFTPISRVISENVESKGTRTFTMKEIKSLFKPFSNLKFEPTPLIEISFIKKHRLISWLANFYPRIIAAWMVVEGQKHYDIQQIDRLHFMVSSSPKIVGKDGDK